MTTERQDILRQLRREIDSYEIAVLEKRLAELPKPKRYKTAKVDGKVVPEHRHVAGLQAGDPLDVHHRDGDRQNNTHTNLEPMTHQQNCLLRGKRQGTSSRYLGGTWDKTRGSWRFRLDLPNDKTKHIGYFKNEDEGALARDKVAIAVYGLGAAALNFYKADNIVEIMKTVQLDTNFLFRQAANVQLDFKRRTLGTMAQTAASGTVGTVA